MSLSRSPMWIHRSGSPNSRVDWRMLSNHRTLSLRSMGTLVGLTFRFRAAVPLNFFLVQNFTAARPSGSPSAVTARLACIRSPQTVLAIAALLVLAPVDPAGLADPLGPPPPVGELGRVVEYHERADAGGGPVARRENVAGEDLAFADPVIGEEAVGRLGGGPVLAGERDAPAHRARHPREQRTQPPAQPLVGEPASGDLAIDPGIRVAGHRHLPEPPRCQRARGLAVRHDRLLLAPRTNDVGNCKMVSRWLS